MITIALLLSLVVPCLAGPTLRDAQDTGPAMVFGLAPSEIAVGSFVDVKDSPLPELVTLVNTLNDALNNPPSDPIDAPVGGQSGTDDDLEDYKPIRFTVDYSSLDSFANSVKVDAIKNVIMPPAIQEFQQLLHVKPLEDQPLDLRSRTGGERGTCFNSQLPQDNVPDTDFLLIVEAVGSNDSPCNADGVAAFGGTCVFDTFPFNARAGRITFCIDRIQTLFKNGQELVSAGTLESWSLVAKHEMVHALGLVTDLLPYWTNPATNQPYGFQDPGTFTCVNGDSTIEEIPSNVQSSFYGNSNNHVAYAIATPTVARVVSNLFNCPRLAGARLENQPSSRGPISGCIGGHLDQRLYYGSLFATTLFPGTNGISPITLALLEDTGWYKVLFSGASTATFGAGAGCDFVNQDCIDPATGIVNPHSEGLFCTSDSSDACSTDFSSKAFCDLTFQDVPHEFAYFVSTGEPRLSGRNAQLDYCPVASSGLLPCSGGSKCFNRHDGGNSDCFLTECSTTDFSLKVTVDGTEYSCTDSKRIQIENLGEFVCPRVAAVCPHLVCPSLCSGRGICDWDGSVPRCICDDAQDSTPGCTGFENRLGVAGLQSPSNVVPATQAPIVQAPAPVVSPTQAPVVPPTQAPIVSPTQAPVRDPATLPTPKVIAPAPFAAPTQAPVVPPIQAPVRDPATLPTPKVIAPFAPPTQAPVVPPTQAPVRDSATLPTPKVIAPFSQPTQAPVVPPTQAPVPVKSAGGASGGEKQGSKKQKEKGRGRKDDNSNDGSKDTKERSKYGKSTEEKSMKRRSAKGSKKTKGM